MTVLCLIVNYGSSNKQYLLNLINGLNCIKGIDFDIILFSTENNSLDGVREIIFNPDIGTNLTYQPYVFLQKTDISMYDYILYTENDLLYNEQNFYNFFEINMYLEKKDMCAGFMRYESKENKKFLVDANNDFTPPVNKIDNISFISPANVHSGCWLFSQNQYQKIKSKNINIGHTLEERASSYYNGSWPGTKQGYRKMIPTKNFDHFLIHHQPDKYCNIYTTEQPAVDDYKTNFLKYE